VRSRAPVNEEAPGDEGLPHLISSLQGLPHAFLYRAALPLSSRTLNFAVALIRRHLKAIGSRWRKLDPARQALLILAYLRKGAHPDKKAEWVWGVLGERANAQLKTWDILDKLRCRPWRAGNTHCRLTGLNQVGIGSNDPKLDCSELLQSSDKRCIIQRIRDSY
jgi:hypothetical protein